MNIKDSMLKIGIKVKDEKDLQKFITEKNELLKAFDSFDLNDIEPMFHLNEVGQEVLREDEVESMDRKDMLENAINTRDNYVVIKGEK